MTAKDNISCSIEPFSGMEYRNDVPSFCFGIVMVPNKKSLHKTLGRWLELGACIIRNCCGLRYLDCLDFFGTSFHEDGIAVMSHFGKDLVKVHCHLVETFGLLYILFDKLCQTFQFPQLKLTLFQIYNPNPDRYPNANPKP